MPRKIKWIHRIIAMLLVLSICFSISPLNTTMANEKESTSEQTETTHDTNDSENSTTDFGLSSQEENSNDNDSNFDTDNSNESSSLFEDSANVTDSDIIEDNAESESNVADSVESNTSNINTYIAGDDTQAFSLGVTFDGVKLRESEENHITNDWSTTDAKTMEVIVQRNKSFDVDSNKKYVLCLKTSDIFYFTGLPDISKITGTEDIAMIQNEAPVINTAWGETQKLSSFSPYSGEIRIEINPSVDRITIPNIGINYNVELVGYTGNTQTIANPVSVSIKSIDKNKDIKNSSNDFRALQSINIDAIDITTLNVTIDSNNYSSFYSTDDFKNMNEGTKGKLNTDNKISFYLRVNKLRPQLYKKLVLVLNCPYIEIDGEKHYLSFDENSTALTDNKIGTQRRFKLSKKAEYNPEEHTITYTFENIYLFQWQTIAYSPNFYWPEELDKNITDNYTIKNYRWEIVEQECYTGSQGSCPKVYNNSGNTNIVYMPSYIDVLLQSSNEANGKTGLPLAYINKDNTRENGINELGFFDIENNGTQDTPEVLIKVKFNMNDKATAQYYVSKLIGPSGKEETIAVNYTLTNGTSSISGTQEIKSSNSKLILNIQDFRTNSKVGNDYYIGEVSYKTVLRGNSVYHDTVTHSYAYRSNIAGLFSGAIEGNVGGQAYAQMSISSVDGITPLTKDGKTEITAVEKSTIS